MDVVITIIGAALIAVALRDIFHTLFHPGGRGSLSHAVSEGAWRATRMAGRLRPAALTLSGPLVVLAVIATWLILVVAGWTLIYWRWLPEAYLGEGLSPGAQSGPLAGLYLSLVTVATLGYGDIVPADGWLRVVTPLQALVGFGLLTAAITWVLSIYPALSRMRSLGASAIGLDASLRTSGAVSLQALDATALVAMLSALEARVSSVRIDLIQYPATYYFNSAQPDMVLAEALPAVRRLALEAEALSAPTVRVAGAWLNHSLSQLTTTMSRQFPSLPEGGVDEVLSAYGRERAPRRG